MNIQVLKTQDAYEKALSQAHLLVTKDPEQGTPEAEKLELLTLLIEDYERRNFPFDVPDPISAIEFRMEEQGLRQKDLISIIGSRSRVSEVLARKRALTIPMIRSISEILGIPAHILIRSPIASNENDKEPEWKLFPFEEMQKRGWIPKLRNNITTDIERIVRDFLVNAAGRSSTENTFFRRTRGLGYDTLQQKARYSSMAWSARVLQRSVIECSNHCKFRISSLSSQFLRQISTLSAFRDGPLIAIQELKKIGICVIVEPRLPNTLIDGAALLNVKSQPVIGLTLRRDRIDYFWFTLLHELAHIWKHLNTRNEAFVDRIDSTEDEEQVEKEANRIARDALIPRSTWLRSIARLNPNSETIIKFASEIDVHPAIVAGRLRFDLNAFNRFTHLLGEGSVRPLFGTS